MAMDLVAVVTRMDFEVKGGIGVLPLLAKCSNKSANLEYLGDGKVLILDDL